MKFYIDYEFTEEETKKLQELADKYKIPLENVINEEYGEMFWNVCEEICRDLAER